MKRISIIVTLILFNILFTSCYFFTSAEDTYIEVTPSSSDTSSTFTCYLFEDYDSLLQAAPEIINDTFTDWYLNSGKLSNKIKKYRGNIDYHSDSNTKMEEYSSSSTSYIYCLYQDKNSTLSSGSSSLSISGTYFIISDYNSQVSTVLYKY